MSKGCWRLFIWTKDGKGIIRDGNLWERNYPAWEKDIRGFVWG